MTYFLIGRSFEVPFGVQLGFWIAVTIIWDWPKFEPWKFDIPVPQNCLESGHLLIARMFVFPPYYIDHDGLSQNVFSNTTSSQTYPSNGKYYMTSQNYISMASRSPLPNPQPPHPIPARNYKWLQRRSSLHFFVLSDNNPAEVLRTLSARKWNPPVSLNYQFSRRTFVCVLPNPVFFRKY